MEHKIGEIFEYNGEWYQCVQSKECNGCAFHGDEDKCCMEECTIIGRSDGTPVIFKKLEKVGEPYMDGGKIMQKYKRVYREPIYFPYKELNCYNDLHGRICIEIKQTNEDMEEKNNGNTPLNVLTDKYVNGDICYDDFEKEIKALYSCKEEIKQTLKEFDLEAAKSGKPVCTRDGRKARIICFDAKMKRNIIALIQDNEFKDEEIAVEYFPNGCFYDNDFDTSLDLMMHPEKKEGWIVINKEAVYDKETAEKIAKETTADVIRIQKIEW